MGLARAASMRGVSSRSRRSRRSATPASAARSGLPSDALAPVVVDEPPQQREVRFFGLVHDAERRAPLGERARCRACGVGGRPGLGPVLEPVAEIAHEALEDLPLPIEAVLERFVRALDDDRERARGADLGARDLVPVVRLDVVVDALARDERRRRWIPKRAALDGARAAGVAEQHALLGGVAHAIHELDGAEAVVVRGRVSDLDGPRRRQLEVIGRSLDLDARRGVGLGLDAVARLLAHRASQRRLQPESIGPALGEGQLDGERAVRERRRQLTALARLAQ